MFVSISVVTHRVVRIAGVSLVFLLWVLYHTDHYLIVLSGFSDSYSEFRALALVDGIIEDELGPCVGTSVLYFKPFYFEATAVKLWQTQTQVT